MRGRGRVLAFLALACASLGAAAGNTLGRERSPYLRESASSPVHWSAWSDAAFERARERGQLVFVSIGYSSCHWCRVMTKESFADAEVARLLNRAFVSLKVDGEELPDVEQRFLARLEALGIAPGWPMTFALTPDDGVIWGATYVDRDTLLATIERLEKRWRADRKRMVRLAEARRADAGAPPAAASAGATVAAREAFERASERIAAEFDPLHKGFGRAAKFPATADLAVLAEAFHRGGPETYGKMVIATASAIATGGLYDPIDGGVFRYSVDRDWLRPHFEKMLYDQADVARLICEAYTIDPDPVLSRSALALLEFATTAFATPGGLLAASLDADSGGVEGGYYLWTQAELDALTPGSRAATVAGMRSVALPGDRVLLAPAGAAALDLPAAAIAELRGVRLTHPAPRRDEKAITAWNADFAGALATCGSRLGLAPLGARARTHMRRLLAVNVPGDRMHRYSLGPEAFGRATIDDFAWMLAALVALHDADGTAEWIGHARTIVAALLALGKTERDGQLRDFTTDRMRPAASAVLLRALAQLARRSADPVFAAASANVTSVLSSTGAGPGFATLAAALYDLQSPAPRMVAYAANGRIRLSVEPMARSGMQSRLSVVADIAPGWHVNSDAPLQDYLRPTRIVVAGAKEAAVTYPRSRMLRLGSSGDEIAVLDGTARIEVQLPARSPPTPVRLTVELQACNDEYCLRPESLQLLAPSQ